MITKSNYYNSLIINLSILILIFPINIFCSNPYINLDKYKIDSIFNKRLERILDTCINKGLFDSILSSKAGYCLISENDSTNYLSNKSIANEIPINKKYYKLLDSIFQNLIDLNLIHNKNYSYRIYEFNKIFKAMEDEREKYYKPIHFKKIYKTITTNEKTQNINKIDSLYLICDYSYNSVIYISIFNKFVYKRLRLKFIFDSEDRIFFFESGQFFLHPVMMKDEMEEDTHK